MANNRQFSGDWTDPEEHQSRLQIRESLAAGQRLGISWLIPPCAKPMKWPDQISVYHKLAVHPSAPGSDPASFELHAMIVSEARQRPAARCHEDLVVYDYKQARKTPLPPFMTDQFNLMWEQQEAAKKTWQLRILDIENQVRSLEMESWDREGAVEDLGSAARS